MNQTEPRNLLTEKEGRQGCVHGEGPLSFPRARGSESRCSFFSLLVRLPASRERRGCASPPGLPPLYTQLGMGKRAHGLFLYGQSFLIKKRDRETERERKEKKSTISEDENFTKFKCQRPRGKPSTQARAPCGRAPCARAPCGCSLHHDGRAQRLGHRSQSRNCVPCS